MTLTLTLPPRPRPNARGTRTARRRTRLPPRVRHPAPPAAAPTPVSWARRVVALLLLATGLVFCHGCHDDEDNELSAGLWRTRQQPEKVGRQGKAGVFPARPAGIGE